MSHSFIDNFSMNGFLAQPLGLRLMAGLAAWSLERTAIAFSPPNPPKLKKQAHLRKIVK